MRPYTKAILCADFFCANLGATYIPEQLQFYLFRSNPPHSNKASPAITSHWHITFSTQKGTAAAVP